MKLDNNWLQENGLYKCPFCKKEYSKFGIITHIWRNHTKEGKTFINNNLNRTAWNRGLTKNTDDRVLKGGNTLSSNIKSGKTIPNWKGRKHTDKSKKQISKSRIKYLQEHPEMVPYLVNHSSKMSYPEQLLFDKLTELNLTGWKFKFRNGIYEYDFAWPEIKLDVEVDGGTHQLEKVKKIDEKRDKFSRDNGWAVLRFTSNNIKYNIDNCIQQIKNKL